MKIDNYILAMENHSRSFILMTLLLLPGCGSSSSDIERMREAEEQLLGGQFSGKTFNVIVRYSRSSREATRANACASLAVIARRYGGEVEARATDVLIKALS